ncbi:hypothetical protein BT69DRAFT_1326712 [Atractiella rhizophila]|nr:hypothetical protein BT69DRAFT_1326712 [Atractiella rhizophila]
MIFPPFMNTLLRNGLDDIFWALLIPTTVVDPKLMGTLNGLMLSLMSATRASPASFASLYAKGVEGQIFRGYLAWVVLFVLCVFMAVNSGFLHPKAGAKKKVGLPRKCARSEGLNVDMTIVYVP